MSRGGTKPARVTYVPALDGMRGVSLPGTIYTHFHIFLGVLPTAPWWVRRSGPFILNIEMFFVLSGALITSLLVSEYQRSGTIALDSFYLRRSRRLGPAMLAVVPLLLISQFLLPGAGPHPLGTSPWMTGLFLVLFVGNWQLATGGNLGWLGPAWTLGIEEQFYLTWPVLLRGALRRSWTRERLLLAVSSMITLTVGVSAVLVRQYPPHRAVYMTPTQVAPILLGCVLGYVLMTNADGWFVRMLRLRVSALVGLGAMVAISAFLYTKQTFLMSGGYVLYAAAACLLIGHCMALADRPSWVSKVLGWRPFVVIGKVSYEAYLVHCVVILAVLQVAPRMPVPDMIVLDLALIAVISGAFYHLIEQPIRRYGWLAAFRRRRRAARPEPRTAPYPARSRTSVLAGFASAAAVVVFAAFLVATAGHTPAGSSLVGAQPDVASIGLPPQAVPDRQPAVSVPRHHVAPTSEAVTAPQPARGARAAGASRGWWNVGIAPGAVTPPALEAPQIISLRPATGTVPGGNVVTIRGRHFTRDARVYFAAQPVRDVTWLDSRTLRIVVPPARTVAVNTALTRLHGLKAAVRVATAGGTSAVGAGDLYTYI